jgi:hypothetical protein
LVLMTARWWVLSAKQGPTHCATHLFSDE